MFTRIIFSLLLFSSFTNNLDAQSDTLIQTVYLDYQLDYYPHFKTVREVDKKWGRMTINDFFFVLAEIFNSCNYKVNEISIFSGMKMQGSGLYPEPLKKVVWITLRLDEKGKVEKLDFNNADPDDQIKDCILQTINDSLLNPSLLYNTPVKSQFYLILN